MPIFCIIFLIAMIKQPTRSQRVYFGFQMERMCVCEHVYVHMHECLSGAYVHVYVHTHTYIIHKYIHTMVGKVGGRSTRQRQSLQSGSREQTESRTQAKKPQGQSPMTHFIQLDLCLKSTGDQAFKHESTRGISLSNHNWLHGAQVSTLAQSHIANSSLHLKHTV